MAPSKVPNLRRENIGFVVFQVRDDVLDDAQRHIPKVPKALELSIKVGVIDEIVCSIGLVTFRPWAGRVGFEDIGQPKDLAAILLE